MYVCTFISCQKGRQIILKSICLLKSCGKNNNIARADGSSTALCGFPYPPVRFSWLVHRAPAPSPSAALAQCLDLAWLGLIEGPKHKSRHISMRLCATWLDCTRTTESYAAIHAWNMTRCWYTPAASRRGAAWERKRGRDGRLHCCTARNVIDCSCLYLLLCRASSFWLAMVEFKDCQLSGK